jgi:hypothetical protein
MNKPKRIDGWAFFPSVGFAILKLLGIIDWSWWLVLLPMIVGTIFNFISRKMYEEEG